MCVPILVTSQVAVESAKRMEMLYPDKQQETEQKEETTTEIIQEKVV